MCELLLFRAPLRQRIVIGRKSKFAENHFTARFEQRKAWKIEVRYCFSIFLEWEVTLKRVVNKQRLEHCVMCWAWFAGKINEKHIWGRFSIDSATGVTFQSIFLFFFYLIYRYCLLWRNLSYKFKIIQFFWNRIINFKKGKCCGTFCLSKRNQLFSVKLDETNSLL